MGRGRSSTYVDMTADHSIQCVYVNNTMGHRKSAGLTCPRLPLSPGTQTRNGSLCPCNQPPSDAPAPADLRLSCSCSAPRSAGYRPQERVIWIRSSSCIQRGHAVTECLQSTPVRASCMTSVRPPLFEPVSRTLPDTPNISRTSTADLADSA